MLNDSHFFCPTMWISYMCAYIPPSWASLCSPSGHHRAPSWAPCALQQLPASYFTHGSLCMSVLLSQFIPPSPSNKYCMLIRILESRKRYRWTYLQGRNRDIVNGHMFLRFWSRHRIIKMQNKSRKRHIAFLVEDPLSMSSYVRNLLQLCILIIDISMGEIFTCWHAFPDQQCQFCSDATI